MAIIRRRVVVIKQMFSKEFKQEAVRLLEKQEKDASQLARELGVRRNQLYKWQKELESYGDEAFPGKGRRSVKQDETANLKARIKRIEQENLVLTKVIQHIFNENRQVYGAPRIHRVLIEKGYHCSLNRVARLMRKANIVPKTIRKFRVTTDSRKSINPTSNLLNRQFSPGQVNRVWASDVTYIPTREGWLFLAVVLDLYSRKVIGWSMSDRLTSCLAQQALLNALNQRRINDGVLHHSDQGKEYYAHEFQMLLKKNRMIGSMSRKGECYDNAVVESFFHSLKIELVHQCDYHNREEARRSLF